MGLLTPAAIGGLNVPTCIHHAGPKRGRWLVAEILAAFPTCSIPEVPRLDRTLRRCRSAILVYFDTNGVSNGPTEAVNGVIELMRRVARGLRNFENYYLCALLAACGHQLWRKTSTHAYLRRATFQAIESILLHHVRERAPWSCSLWSPWTGRKKPERQRLGNLRADTSSSASRSAGCTPAPAPARGRR